MGNHLADDYTRTTYFRKYIFSLIEWLTISPSISIILHMSKRYHWDSVFEIALALKARYPDETLENVSLEMIYEWVTALPEFKDDLELANDGILLAIFQEWYEELD